MRVLVLDVETPWVTSLFKATEPGIQVDFLGILNIRERRFKPQFSLAGMFRKKTLDTWHSERYFWTLTRFPTISRAWIRLYLRFVFGKTRVHDAVVFTNPFGAELLDIFKNCICVYDAHDVFEYYPHLQKWPIRQLEQRLLDNCDVVAVVASRLTADFRLRRTAPVIHLPMAASKEWLGAAKVERPHDLPSGAQIVGCTGQINCTYDWDMIKAVTRMRRDFMFVFVGPVVEGDERRREEINEVFSLPNVRWLGPKPHQQLRSYINSFDVCFCPLVRNDHNDRRSPLRLFDYMTTSKPIATTDIAEAYQHKDHIVIVKNAVEMSDFLIRVQSSDYVVNWPARLEYMKHHTWEARASVLVGQIREAMKNAGKKS